ncbi:nucleotide exchange factor SIL1 isoform X1 [Xyrauchen texanus]|uniref:nucleotide exchange factor SIL1 isoform X1 n=1 Tax=Xyrauchen texanus TaxID=154827 RepID=UPI002242B49A|nr:nucleotide exchange factor SIL1 isoform X1 [Xyrauchen texanus]
MTFSLSNITMTRRIMQSKRSSSFGVTITLWLYGLHLICAHNVKSPTALTIKEDSGDLNQVEETQLDDEDPEDLEVFHPTNNWQTLRPGQAVPAGSHVRLNLQTGQREVKLGEEEGFKYWRDGNRQGMMNMQTPSFTAQELKEALKYLKEGTDDSSGTKQDEEEVRAKFRPIEELKKDMKALDMLIETDVQVMKRLLTQFNDSKSTSEEKVAALLDLEYLVHQVDNAQNMVSMGGMHLVINALNSTDIRLQESAAFVLGSAVSSNPSVQVEAVEGGGLQKLLTLLATQRPMAVKKKELISQAGLDIIPDSTHQERLRQYAEVSLLPVLVEQGWCGLVPELLASSEHDWREKALRTLLAMMAQCQTPYKQNPTLTTSLNELHKQYKELALTEQDIGEQDGYFGEILALVNAMLFKMQHV